MVVGSVSYTVVNPYSPASSATPSRTAAAAPVASPVERDRDDPPAREVRPQRRSGLVEAIRAAFRDLLPAAAAAAPAATPAATPSVPAGPTTTPAPGTAAATGNSAPAANATSADAEHSVENFAHALWQALQGAAGGPGNGQSSPDGEQHGRGHHHGHHRHGYGDLAQRLESLAATLSPTPAPAAATPAAASPAKTVAAATALPVAPLPTSVPTAATPASPQPVAAPSLVDAFKSMLKALGTDSASATEPSTLLANFLHRIAGALAGNGSGASAASGQLLHVCA